MDVVSVRRDGKSTQLEGRIEITAQDEGILLLGRDGVLWRIPPKEMVERPSHNDAPFRRLFGRGDRRRGCCRSCPRASTSTRRRIT